MGIDAVSIYAAATPPPPHELVLESGDLSAETADEIHVLGDMVVNVQGVAGGVRLDVLRAIGIFQGVEGFFEGRRCTTGSIPRGRLKNGMDTEKRGYFDN